MSSFPSHRTTDEGYVESDSFSSGIDTDVNEGDACQRKLFLLGGRGGSLLPQEGSRRSILGKTSDSRSWGPSRVCNFNQ